MVLQIGTLNCRGGSNKIDLLIDTIERSQIDILGLQETHDITDFDKKKIEKSCKGNLHLNNGSTSSRGVATFVRGRDDLIDKGIIKRDSDSRLLAVSIKFKGKNCFIINAYAPNDAKQRNNFFIMINQIIQNYSSERIFFLGDFNNILDRQLDRTNNETKGAMKSDKSRETLSQILQSNYLVDAYRHLHPFGIMYTFTGSGGYRGRLDRIYIDKESAKSITSVITQGIPYTDHDLVILTSGVPERGGKWGNGRWILNKKLLFDKQTQDDLRDVWLHWRERKGCFTSILDWWDKGKRLIADVFQVNGKRLKREMENEVMALERELNSLLSHVNIDRIGTDRIRQIKNRLWEIQEGKIEASRIRSKEQWLDKREKCSRFFYEEERRKGKLKTMKSLKIRGKIVTGKDEVCAGAISFYQELYNKQTLDSDRIQRLIDRHIDRKLTDEQRDSIEGIVRKEELLKALKGMKNDKSPGLDGLTREFYILNWDLVGSDLADVTANIYLQDRLPDSWTEGLITLIYKEKGDINDLKHWRPITLLNTDYKIYSKTLADRLRKVTGHVIDIDQGCALGGRTIHDQLHYITDLIDYYKETKNTSMLLTIDQEKAFDRVHHELLFRLLRKLNFGPMVTGQIEIIYSKMTSRLMINGHMTDHFDVSRSVRQGDGLSMILFVIVAELLAQTIRHNIDIRPISLPNSRPKKLTQYADDTTIMTENKRVLPSIEKMLRNFENITGAKIT